jgi:hypothetical protein
MLRTSLALVITEDRRARVIGEVNAKVLFTVLGELLSEFNFSIFGVFELK